MSKVAIIGAGFSGLSAAAYLSKAGHKVFVFEKNESAGGRARQLVTENGYVFDMGPSWYWMPGVFENFFRDFGYHVPELYPLTQLDPGFEMVFDDNDSIKLPADYDEIRRLFESIEKGSAKKLDLFMAEARYKYETGMENLSAMPGISLAELMKPALMKGVFRLQVFSSFSSHVRKYFKDPRLIKLMEFPVLFLGAMPKNIPALYSLMNYAGIKLGTWYAHGGFGAVIKAMQYVCEQQGVEFHFNSEVKHIKTAGRQTEAVMTNHGRVSVDAVIASADYQHVEEKLLPPGYANYSNAYWGKKTFAPSSLIYYLGFRKRLQKLEHHTLFFKGDIDLHAQEIYSNPQWPTNPLFYACCPSQTDDSVAPAGHENVFLLMPLATGLQDDEETRERYFKLMMHKLEEHTGETNLEDWLDYKRSYCVSDFIKDYNSYKGNAYGLANTLRQTAHLKPSIKNRKISNLFYAGQLTVPGPGVPPSIISGKMAAELVLKELQKKNYEIVV